MKTRHAVHYEQAEAMSTADLRDHFVLERMFRPGSLEVTYTHYDRMLVAGAMPVSSPLRFADEHATLVGTDFVLQRRELGLINIGGPGRVIADGIVYDIGFQDGLYLSLGTKEVSFESTDPENPAKFYINTCPAHAPFPSRRIGRKDAIENDLGDSRTSNKRKLYQYLHPKVLPTCQLLMGLTRLETGSVWNTMPAHTHERRMEAYLYFELPDDTFVVHLMGRPSSTRHLIMRNEQAVLSPPWSIHCGAGTSAYAFIWSMAGDNQVFTDMDAVGMRDML